MPIDLRLDARRFNQLALFATLIGFGLLIVAFVATIASAIGNQRATIAVRHTYQVIDELDAMSLAIERVETAVRGYLLAPSPIRAETRRRNEKLIQPSFDKLRAMTADNPRQQRTLAELHQKIQDQLATNDDIMGRAERNQLDSARAEFVERVKIRQIDQIRTLERAVRDEEVRLLTARQALESSRRTQISIILAATGLLLLLIGGAFYWLVRRYTKDLTATRDRLHLLNTDLESAVAERTADLQRANDEIQRFAYIVSHDLRSPLVNVMGFTAELEAANKAIGSLIDRAETEAPQLLTTEAQYAREDLPEAIGFIRSSTQKMDRLINAILNLSRQGRRVLSPERLDMRRVVDDIVKSLATQMDERSATVEVQGALPDIHHDRLAIEQIFQNLIENATKYLRNGVPGRIKIRGQRSGKRAIFEVEDNGRGVDPNDHERIFELFRRSGTQDQRGEGIGLAHVRALAYRLGGTVTIRSAIDEGSTFIVDLPMTYAAEGKDQ
jgi:signal transduction histidine kinase